MHEEILNAEEFERLYGRQNLTDEEVMSPKDFETTYGKEYAFPNLMDIGAGAVEAVNDVWGPNYGIQDLAQRFKERTMESAARPSQLPQMLGQINKGLTGGFSSNIIGAARAAGDVVGGEEPSKLLDLYRKHRDRIRAQDDAYKQTAPVAANTLSGVASAFSPLNKIPGLGPTEGIAANVINMGRRGAVEQLGESRNDYTQGAPSTIARNLASDLGWGAGTGMIAGGVSSSIPAGMKSMAAHLTNTPKKILDIYLKHKGTASERFKKLEDAIPRNLLVSENFQKAYKQLQELAFGGSKESAEILKKEAKTIPVGDLIAILKNQAKEIKADTPKLGFIPDADKKNSYQYFMKMAREIESAQMNYFNKMIKKLEANKISLDQAIGAIQGREELPFYELKRLVQGMQKVGWKGHTGDPSQKIEKGAIRNIEGIINRYIKKQVPEYGDIMDQVAKDTALVKEIGSTLGKNIGSRIDGVKRAFSTSEFGKGSLGLDAIRKLDERLGTSLESDIQWSLLREAFDRSAAQGSRNPKVMAELAKHAPELAKTGFFTALGATMDQSGRTIARKAMDLYIFLQNVGKYEGQDAFEKAISPIIEAARQGDKTAAAVRFLIEQTNPKKEVR